MSEEYDVGDMIKCSVTFRKKSTNELVDPSTIKLTIQQPNFSKIEYNYPADNNIVKESTGSYYYEMIPTMDGIHIYQFTGSGNVYAVEQSTFFVKPSRFS